MNFKTLLWKEYRQSRLVLVSMGVMLLLPYATVIVVNVVVALSDADARSGIWLESLAGASIAGLFISAVLCAFLSAQVVAGERADRSAEFACYLPISRGHAVSAKALFAAAVCALMILANVAVNCLVESLQDGMLDPRMFGLAGVAATLAVLVFGVSWAVSALSARPPIGAASGLLSTVLLLMLFEIMEFATGIEGLISAEVGAGIAAAVGLTGFVVGTLWTVRRVEP